MAALEKALVGATVFRSAGGFTWAPTRLGSGESSRGPRSTAVRAPNYRDERPTNLLPTSASHRSSPFHEGLRLLTLHETVLIPVGTEAL